MAISRLLRSVLRRSGTGSGSGDRVAAAGSASLHSGSGEDGGCKPVGHDGSEQRTAATRLERAERVAQLGNWHVSLPGAHLTWSDEVCRIHGVEPGQTPATVEEAIAFYHPEDRPVITRAVERAFETGDTFETRLRIVRRDGDVRHVYIKAEVQLSPEGTPLSCFGIIQDVTEAQEVQRLLSQAEQIAQLGHWRLRSDQDEMVWSDQACRICGFEPGEVAPTARNFAEIIHPEDRSRFNVMANVDLRNGAKSDETFRIFRPSGEMRHVRIRVDADAAVSGEVVTWFGIIEDVTDRMLTERYLSQAEEIANLGHWRHAIQTDQFHWSDQVFRIFGYEPGAFEPSIRHNITLYHPDDRPAIRDIINHSMSHAEAFDFTLRIVRADGAERHVEVRGEPDSDGEGGIAGFFGTIQDVTDRITTEQALMAEKERAELADKAKADFLATMSHEIRTPLNAIIGFAEVMQEETFGPLGNERYRDYMENITSSGRHLLSLLSNILDLSRIEADGYSLTESEFCLTALLAECSGMMGGAARDRRITLSDDPRHRFRVRADERAIKQIVLNLLSNAIKFTEAGGSVVVTATERKDGGCAVTISDTGIGIPRTALEEVLKPFQQARSALTANRSGAGIGLALSKRLIEMHDGEISIDSAEGWGTAVTVTLPPDRVLRSILGDAGAPPPGLSRRLSARRKALDPS